MTDIPYGDCFSVDMFIQVAPATLIPSPSAPSKPPSCTIQAHLRVNFTRKCLFKRIIDSGTHKQCMDFYTDLFNSARSALETPAASAAAAAAAAAASGTASPTRQADASPIATALSGDHHKAGHQRMPSLASMVEYPMGFGAPGQPAFGLGSDAAGGQHAGQGGLFGLHPVVLVMLVASLLLQVSTKHTPLRAAPRSMLSAAACLTACHTWAARCTWLGGSADCSEVYVWVVSSHLVFVRWQRCYR